MNKKNNNKSSNFKNFKIKNKKFKKFKNSLLFFSDVVKWLSNACKLGHCRTTVLLKLVQKIFKILKTRGDKECIRYTKDLRLKFLKILFNDFSYSNLDFKIPKVLKPVIREYLIDKEPLFLRLTLSVLYITRFIRLKPEPSYDSIEGPPLYKGNAKQYNHLIPLFLKDIGVNLRFIGKPSKKILFKGYHVSVKSGPNGLSMWNSLSELNHLPNSLISSLGEVGGLKLATYIVNCMYYINSNLYSNLKLSPFSGSIRKLALISDKEGKTREVAMGDYWSQTSLKPLHLYHFKFLKGIWQDCTFDQTKHITKLKCTPGSSFHSIDLRNATDRFPIVLQEQLLSVWFGSKYAKHWKNIMVGFSFDLPGAKNVSNRKVNYNTGNPMGFYSSWSTFALTHHFLIWLACYNHNKQWTKCPYMLLGDDIVIADDTIAKEYMSLLVFWGIDFSKDKTHTSKFGYEFAKQICFQDTNVSPLPLVALYRQRNNLVESLNIIFSELHKKDWMIEKGLAIESYVRFIFKFSSKRYAKIRSKIDLTFSILDYLQGRSINLGTALMVYVNSCYSVPETFNVVMQQVYANTLLVDLLKSSKVEDRKDQSMKSLRSHDNFTFMKTTMDIYKLYGIGFGNTILESIPFCNYHKNMRILKEIRTPKFSDKDLNIMDRFTPRLYKEIYSVDSSPMTVKDLYTRNRDVEIRSSWNMASALQGLVRTTKEIRVMGDRKSVV